MKGVPKGQRGAYYKAVIVLMIDEETQIIAEGECHGEIAFEPRGDKGFGFDPIFYYPELQKTTAEITPEEKNKISHRGKALELLKGKLDTYLSSKA